MEQKKLSILVSELQAGNSLVFEEIYHQTQQKLYVYALSIMKNESDAKDLLQETYIEIIKSIQKLQRADKFLPWSKKILFYLAMQKFRKDGSAVILDEKYESLIEDFRDTDDSIIPEEAYDANEVKAIIRGIIDELPTSQQVTMIAYYYDEMNIQEIAEMMECSENTIKTRLHYGRLAAKDKVEDYEKKHDIRLHALTPLLFASMGEYGQADAMSMDSAKALAEKIVEQINNLENISAGTVTGAQVASMGQAATAAGGIVTSKLIAVIVIAVISVSGIGFGIAQSTSSPEKTIESFERSFNKGDTEGLISCMDPEIQAMYKVFTNFANATIGMNTDALLSSIFSLTVGVDQEGKLNLDIVIENIEKDGNVAHAEVYMVLYQGKELYDSTNDVLVLNKIGRKWYIMK
ncbi:MAG: RNA polymerase sigma factor [Anaerovoracaceae bacterium]